MAELSPPSLGAVARRSRTLILVSGILIGGACYGYTKFIVKPIYLARTEISVPSGGSPLGDLSVLIGGGGQESPLQFLRGLFESRATRQYLAKQAKEKHNRPASVPDIDEIYAAKAQVDTSQLFLEVKHEDKDFALSLLREATRYVRQLDEQTAGAVATSKFDAYESSLQEKTVELNQANEALRKWMESSKTATDPANPFAGASYRSRLDEVTLKLGSIENTIDTIKRQAKNSAQRAKDFPTELQGAERWRDLIVQLELDLRIAENTYSRTSPQVIAKKRQIDETKKKFEEEVRKFSSSVENDSNLGLPALLVERQSLIFQRDALREMARIAPSEAIVQQKLVSDQQIKAGVVAELRKQAEIATVEAKVKRINWALLGDSYVLDKPINKGAFVNGVLGVIGGSVGFLAIAFVLARGRYLKKAEAQAPREDW